MNTPDIRDSFCEPLKVLIEKHMTDGYSYIPVAELRKTITAATKHRDEFFPAFTDEEVARIVSDASIDWHKCFAADGHSTQNITVLSDILLHMSMDEYVAWIPHTQEALNQRYTPSSQAELLKQSEAMPGYSGDAIEGRQMLTGRIVPLILQSEKHLDAWVDQWMMGLKFQERIGRALTKPFSETARVTKAFKRLKERETRLDAMPILMVFAGLLEPKTVMKSVSRYCDASLYELSNSEHVGRFFNVNDDYLRRTLVYGLFLLKGNALEELVSQHIGGEVIRDNHLALSAALLASSINWHRELIDLDALCQVSAKYETTNAVDILLREHAFNWDRDWFKKVRETEHCKPILSHVGRFEAFRRWALDYASNCRYASMSSMKQLPEWIALMSEDDKQKSFRFLAEQFEIGITVKASQYGTGIFYGKVLLSAFPDEPFAQAKISDQVGYLVKRALKDDHTELLAAVIEKGFVTAKMVGGCVWDVDEFEKLTRSGNLTKKLLLPYVKRKVKVGVLENDLGM